MREKLITFFCTSLNDFVPTFYLIIICTKLLINVI